MGSVLRSFNLHNSKLSGEGKFTIVEYWPFSNKNLKVMLVVYLHTNLPAFTFISSPSFWHKSPSEGDETDGFDVAGLIFGVEVTTSPLFQTSFLPDLMQVYFFPAVIEVAPAFVHAAPAFTAAKEPAPKRPNSSEETRANTKKLRFIAELWQRRQEKTPTRLVGVFS